MTRTRISKHDTLKHADVAKFSIPRVAGAAWLVIWLLVGGGFCYRALTQEDASATAVASVHTTSFDSTAQNLDRHTASLKPIERIEVGERVAFAINPTEGFDDSLGTEIHAHAWRKIELRPDSHSRVVLLRPEWWVKERVQEDSRTMAISIPEVGIHADAEIISITPCPRIPKGDGRVVIGTFAHIAPKTIRLTIDGIDEPIQCTPNHATWSVEARDFIEAQHLEPGHHVLGRDGIYEVASIEHLDDPIEVFNLEVFGQHVYQITTGGMLVHNAGAAGSGGDTVKGYRAVSDAELDDIATTGGFRPHPDSMQDKWFAETLDGAEAYRLDDRYPDLQHVVEAEVPRSVYDRSFQHPNIDGNGPGFAVRAEDQPMLTPITPSH